MIELYGNEKSFNCRRVSLILELLELDYEYKIIDNRNGENLKPDYLTLNPEGTFPVIKDDEFVLTESRAIMAYLVQKYGRENDELYPREPVEVRAKIDQMLNFEMGTFSTSFWDNLNPRVRWGLKDEDFSKETKAKMPRALALADNYVKETGFIAGTRCATIADYSLLATYSTMKECEDILNVDFSPYPDLEQWFERMKGQSKNYDLANGDGIKAYKEGIIQLWDNEQMHHMQ